MGGWRCPQTLELWGHRGYRAPEMSQGWEGAIQGAEAIRPHLSSCIKKKCIIIVFWPCCMACGNLETEAVSPAVDCQISPSVASLFKNIYLIFKILFLCGFLITSWWIICSLPPATSLSLPLPGVCVCVCLRVEELVMTMGGEGSKTWARKIALVHSNLETSLRGPGNLG